MSDYKVVNSPRREDFSRIAARMHAKLLLSERLRSFRIELDGHKPQYFTALHVAYEYLAMIEARCTAYWHTVEIATTELISWRERGKHPDGKFDSSGRFFLSERRECCDSALLCVEVERSLHARKITLSQLHL